MSNVNCKMSTVEELKNKGKSTKRGFLKIVSFNIEELLTPIGLAH
jgi:hypothetical protein